MARQYEILPCPFCDKGEIQCLYFRGAWTVKSSGKGALGKGKSTSKSSDHWIIQSGCPVCGKSAEEVEKELKERDII